MDKYDNFKNVETKKRAIALTQRKLNSAHRKREKYPPTDERYKKAKVLYDEALKWFETRGIPVELDSATGECRVNE